MISPHHCNNKYFAICMLAVVIRKMSTSSTLLSNITKTATYVARSQSCSASTRGFVLRSSRRGDIISHRHRKFSTSSSLSSSSAAANATIVSSQSSSSSSYSTKRVKEEEDEVNFFKERTKTKDKRIDKKSDEQQRNSRRASSSSSSSVDEDEEEDDAVGFEEEIDDTYRGVPLRSTISETDLQKMERLIDEIVDNKDNLMSNRAKFRALPITNKHRKHIEDLEACVSLSEAGKRTQIMRNRATKAAKQIDPTVTSANISPTLRKYILYGDVPEAHKDLLGRTKKRNAKFIAAASKSIEEMPSMEVLRKDENGNDIKMEIPEVAFCGRSNVGKSSLINALTLSAAARSSDTPGKTKSLNFYDIDSRLRVVDLPGYGFAFAGEGMVESWNRLMDEYLTTRKNLKCIFVVIDSRHGAKKSDREMLSYLSKYGKVPVHVVLNKTDMIRGDELAKRMFLLERELKFIKRSSNELKLASASTGAGCTRLFAEAFQYALPDTNASRRTKREKEELEELEEQEQEQEDASKEAEDGRQRQQQQQKQRKRQPFLGGEWIPGGGGRQNTTTSSSSTENRGASSRGNNNNSRPMKNQLKNKR